MALSRYRICESIVLIGFAWYRVSQNGVVNHVTGCVTFCVRYRVWYRIGLAKKYAQTLTALESSAISRFSEERVIKNL